MSHRKLAHISMELFSNVNGISKDCSWTLFNSKITHDIMCTPGVANPGVRGTIVITTSEY